MRLHSFMSKIVNEYNSEHCKKKKKKTLAIIDPQFKANDLFQVEQCIGIYLIEQTMMQQIQFIFSA